MTATLFSSSLLHPSGSRSGSVPALSKSLFEIPSRKAPVPLLFTTSLHTFQISQTEVRLHDSDDLISYGKSSYHSLRHDIFHFFLNIYTNIPAHNAVTEAEAQHICHRSMSSPTMYAFYFHPKNEPQIQSLYTAPPQVEHYDHHHLHEVFATIQPR